MQVSNIVKPTETLEADGKKIEVDSLPKNIRYQIETLDRYRQKRMDIIGEGEMLDFAIQAITANISLLVREFIKKDEPPAKEAEDEAASA